MTHAELDQRRGPRIIAWPAAERIRHFDHPRIVHARQQQPLLRRCRSGAHEVQVIEMTQIKRDEHVVIEEVIVGESARTMR